MLLNPSTADERDDDATLRRCIGFARAGGFGAVAIANLFALRARDPRQLLRSRDPVGRANDRAILAIARRSEAIVLGWGAWGERFPARAGHVRLLLAPFSRRVFVLEWTRKGEPRHPLYLSGRARFTRAR